MRKIKTYAFSISIILVFSGCAAQIKKEQEEVQARMHTWVGANSGELISKRGAPDSSYNLEAGKVAYVYKKEWTTGDNGENKFSCTATYIVNKDGNIIDASFRWQSVFGTNLCREQPTRY